MKLKITTLLFLISYVLQAQENVNLSLNQAIEFALLNNVNVKNSTLDESIARQKVKELTGLGTPQISGSAEIDKFLEIPTTFVPAQFFNGKEGTFAPVKFGQPYSSSVGVSASQLLFDGNYLVGLKASRSYEELSRKQTKQTKIETAVSVSKAYYNVLVNQARFELVNANVERLKKLRNDIKATYETGFAEKLDFDRMDLTYNIMLVQQQNIQKLVDLSYILLKFQLGMDLKSNITLTDKLDEAKWSEVSMPDAADPSKRIEYSVLQTARRLDELDMKRYKSTYLPSLVAFGSYSYNASRSDFTIFDPAYRWYPTAVIGAKLSVPIWDGLQKNSRVQQAKMALQKVDNTLANLQQAIGLEYASAKINLQNSIAELETNRKNREIAKEIVRASKIKYDNGIGSSQEVVDSETTLKEAETNYFNVLYQTIVSKIDLDKSLGNLNY